MESPEVEQLHHPHTGRQWVDLLLGISAVSISFISLFLAIHNGKAMERLVEANSWPYVQITFSSLNSDGTPHIHFSCVLLFGFRRMLDGRYQQNASSECKGVSCLGKHVLVRLNAMPVWERRLGSAPYMQPNCPAD
jgi:hypothetical protein